MALGIRFLSAFIFLTSLSFAQMNLESGFYKGELAMNDRLTIPFEMELTQQKNKLGLTIRNGEERIVLLVSMEKDSIVARFPEMDAYLKFASDGSQNSFRGYWLNLNKKKPISIPFTAYSQYDEVGMMRSTVNITGKWKTTFSPKTSEPETAVGVFKQVYDGLQGTFLTETGDYRYLHGSVDGNFFRLSTFNGSWAFLFEGKVDGDTIKGDFYSGPNYHTDWIAVKDDAATLRDEKTLTQVINDKGFAFENVVTLKNKPFSSQAKKYTNKVVIYQIMGTWCPNCLDEMRLFKELYKEYHGQGLEIVALAYEVGSDKKAQLARLKAFQKKMKLPYEIVLAGTSSKDVAAAQFPMLNGIMSFPTSVFVDKKGKVKTVFTGFSGPATGDAYQQLSDEIRKEIQDMLK